MTAPKIDNSVIAAAAAAGVMPLVAQMVGSSPKVKDLMEELASIEAFAADAHKEVAERYSAFRVRIGEFLSERGLGQLVDDYQAATKEPEPVPATPAVITRTDLP